MKAPTPGPLVGAGKEAEGLRLAAVRAAGRLSESVPEEVDGLMDMVDAG